MSSFADTSFLFAFYLPRSVSEKAVKYVQSTEEALLISAFVRYEFIQAVWFQVWKRSTGQAGLTEQQAQAILGAFEIDYEQGVWVIPTVDWEKVINHAERMSNDQTVRGGVRSLDLLHIATAHHLEATSLLSFDINQRRAALSVGLSIPFAID